MMNAWSPVATAARQSLFVGQLADPGVLREAWYRVQRGGKTAGVDGMTIDAFRSHADRRLTELGDALLADAYRPSPVKRVQIPKPAGGWRILGVPTITDRIAQSAAALVLYDRIAALFSDRSFAYRPFLGPRRAAVSLRTSVASATWAVTADVEKFFDNVEHRILSDQLRNVGVDDGGVRLILRWLLAPAQDRGRQFQPVKGLPQGSPVAPLLANLYLSGFDAALEAEGFAHIRYADDFVVLTPDAAEAQRALRYVTTYLGSRLKLHIKPAKTQLTRADDGFNFVGFRFTRTTWTVPAESLARFQETVAGLLEERRTLVEIAKSHNDLIRGWRQYYFGNSPEMDRQLLELDTWRAGVCRAHLARLGQDPESSVVWFERLAEQAEPSSPAGTYAHDEPTHDQVLASPDSRDEWREGRSEQPSGREGRTVSTERQLRDAEIGRKQVPALLDDGWLRIPTFGGFVTKSRSLIIVRRKKQIVFECAFDDVACVAIEALGVALSTAVIDECARRQVPLIICRASGRPVAHVVPVRAPLIVALAHRQLIARGGKSGTPLIRAILTAKLSNQRALLLYHTKYRRREEAVRRRLIDGACAIDGCLQQMIGFPDLPMRQARRALFLIEARAAAHYWYAFGALIPGALRFRKRTHRGAEEVINKTLNYGYSLLLNHVWVAVRRAGCDASVGLLHTGRRKSAGLVFDLMEPFRQPLVDKTVLALVGRGAHLEVNEAGDLTLRTRALLHRAFVRQLGSPGRRGGESLLREVHQRTLAFRRSLLDGVPYDAFRMTW